MTSPRQRELQKRAQRQQKLATLRRKFKAARTEDERSKILGQVLRVAPTIRVDDFLATVRER
jgi:hypothetical protein